MMTKYDVAVIGLGTTGSMALWQLSQVPDLAVIGLEQFGVGHTYGSFTGESRLFRTAVHEGARYVPMLRRSRSLWQELEGVMGRDLYLEVGALSIGDRGSEPMIAVERTIESFDLEHEVLDSDQLRARYPQHGSITPDTYGILDHHGGGLRAEASVVGAIRAAADNGATVLTNAAVTRIDTAGPTVRIITETAVVEAARVVVTAGSWSHQLLPELDDLIRVTPLSLTWFMPRDPDAFTGPSFPVFLRDIGSVHLFGAPTLDSFSVKISAPPLWEDVHTVADLPVRIDRDTVVELGRHAQHFFPQIDPEPVRMSIHHDGSTLDRTPIIDASDDGRLVILAGLSGHGFKFAPVYGQIARDLAIEGGSEFAAPEFTIASHLERNRR